MQFFPIWNVYLAGFALVALKFGAEAAYDFYLDSGKILNVKGFVVSRQNNVG